MFDYKIPRWGNNNHFENNLPKRLRKVDMKQITNKQLVICLTTIIEKRY
jgi:hypothetical protein